MATNKNAVIRYNTLDKCFSNTGRRYSFDDLIEEVNVALCDFEPGCTGIKTRQLRDDIRFMKSESGYSAPIIANRDGQQFFYCYEDKNFSINNSPLNKTEAEYLMSTIEILKRFEGLPQFEWINEIGPMLTDHFGLKDNDRQVMAYDSNIDYTGYDYISPLFNAIVNNKVLVINYEPFGKGIMEVTFHPYFLKQHNNRWFVLGLNHKNDVRTWNMALDRILDITECSQEYVYHKIDWEGYFYDVIGPTRPDEPVQEIELLFTVEQAPYVRTKPFHASQRETDNEDGSLTVKLKLIPNFELEQKILSFGEKVKVVRPEKLKKRIKLRLSDALKNY